MCYNTIVACVAVYQKQDQKFLEEWQMVIHKRKKRKMCVEKIDIIFSKKLQRRKEIQVADQEKLYKSQNVTFAKSESNVILSDWHW